MAIPSRILISILNWNNARKTIDCVSSLLSDLEGCSHFIKISLIDNGSDTEDFSVLKVFSATKTVSLRRLEENVGFTGGHNISICQAIEEAFDFVWLLNNDAVTSPGCLDKLVSTMLEDPKCGALSPVIYPCDAAKPFAAWGGVHDYESRSIKWATSLEEAIALHESRQNEIFVAGTAILLRVKTMAKIGPLDDRLFAYFDDSDLGARISQAGWHSRVAFDASVSHEWKIIERQPDYFFYLMYRNEMIFWYDNIGRKHSLLLWLKLVNQALYNAARLRRRGFDQQSNAALLGIWDFIIKNHGKPILSRRVPSSVKLIFRISMLIHRKHTKKISHASKLF